MLQAAVLHARDAVNSVIEFAIAKNGRSGVRSMGVAITSSQVLVVGKLLVELDVQLQGLGKRVSIATEVVSAVRIAGLIGKGIKIEYVLSDRIPHRLIDFV